ncbi:caspase family protein [Alteromonas sp. ASW11-130]|uniref:caspase family protein n=1 Tax=Alteromonas sp. ASW11-130 TaxID=3015775 RepID=UPI002241FE6C|nr:caspase family protein [Alteromonas sp. ASW11-130]MCW8091159.1 caspase family protein [Alteromonas sp. ASW11-130]
MTPYRYINVTCQRLRLFWLFSALLFSLAACRSTQDMRAELNESTLRAVDVDQLEVVDCQLPGMVKMLGTMKYVTPRRPARLTANECSIRGGEYTLKDRATLESSLEVWLPPALEGDAKAQNYVGQLYEAGVNKTPDYELAALWYKRAAEQSFKEAQVNLGFLYETGKGVAQDKKKALNLYRQAAGLSDDQLEYESVINERVLTQVNKYQQQLKDNQNHNATLEEKLNALYTKHNATLNEMRQLQEEKRLAHTTNTSTRSPENITTVNERIAQLQRSNQALLAKIDELGAENKLSNAQLRGERESLNRLLNGQSQNSHALQQQLQQKEQELAALTMQMDTLKSTFAAEKAALQKNASQITATSGDQIKQLQSQLLEKSLAVNKVQHENEKYQNQHQAYQATIAQLEQNLAAVASKDAGVADIYQIKIEGLNQELAQNKLKLQNTEQHAKALEIERENLSLELQQEAAKSTQQQQQLVALQLELADNQLLQEQTLATVNQLEADKAQIQNKLEQVTAMNADSTQALENKVAELTAQLTEKDDAITRFSAQHAELAQVNQNLKQKLRNDAQETSGLIQELAAKTMALSQKQHDIIRLETQIDQLSREYKSVNLIAKNAPESAKPKMRAISLSPEQSQLYASFGKFHALIIGNDSYQYLPSLNTTVSDAHRLDRILTQQYGYDTTVLINADRQAILTALYELKKSLNNETNLLIYYAGHGEISDSRGHWLPVDARPNSQVNWIPTQQVTDLVALIEARKIIIVADSCYSGVLTRSSILSSGIRGDINDEKYQRWLKAMARGKSRTVLTSGGLQPVLDSGGGEHSLFAKYFLQALEDNQGIIDAYTLYNQIFMDVKEGALVMDVDQSPQYAPIKNANHYSVDYFFINRQSL